ncbi:MAG: methionyl-tRNA formyltransferase [Bacteroidales bacterium]|nr:methionyl-tRNA formyltransferase [Bacteroidales bacterium]
MKKLDQFILKAFIGPFVAILLVVIFILMMQFLWVYIDELVGKGLGLKVILEFMLWGGCTTLPLCLPLATLLASMMTVGQMAENNELMAIKAAGISLARVFLPLMASAMVISVAAFFVSNNLVPKAYNEIYTLRDDIGKTKNEIKIPAGTFYDGIDGYILRVGSQDKDTRMMYHVMVYDHTSGKGNTSLTLADSAMMKMSKRKDYLTFTLYSGANYSENNVRKYRDTTWQLQHIDFDRQQLIIPLQNYSFEKSDSSRFGDQAKAMKIGQLAPERDSLRRETVRAYERHYASMRVGTNFSLPRQLDTASRAGVDERRDFSDPSFLRWKDREKEIHAYEKAKGKAERLSSDLKSKAGEVYDYYYRLRRTDIEYLKKFAQALACLLLFFIGAPLGALIRKGGLGASAIVSALFFVLYWVVDISGTKLARDGAASAGVGVFISAFVLAPIGAFLTYKSVKDATLFDSDRISTWWRKVKSLVERFFRQKRIVFMGTPEFAVASLDALVKARYKVVGVVTVADKPMGRGLKVQESAVKKYAVEHGIPVLQPLKLKDPEFLEALAAWKADLFVVVAFRMLPEEVWGMPKLGTFNLHAALLPQYRGAAPINWAIINGEKMTGVTTFMLDHNIDTGGIILRHEYRMAPDETAGSLHDALMGIGAELVVETTEGIFQHNVETRVQRSFIQGSEELHSAPKLTKENTRIDWSRPAAGIYNLVRGLSPYPAAWTTFVRGDEVVECKVFFGRVVDKVAEAVPPGTIASDGKTYLRVATGHGWFEVTDLQLAGKKRMAVADFLRGWREPESWKAV